MKRIISLILATVLAIASIFSIGLSAFAVNIDFSKAVDTSVNTPITGNIIRGYNNEKDVYRVTVADNGVLLINMQTPLQADANEYWIVNLYDGSYNALYDFSVHGNKTSTDSVSTGVTSGTYYVCIYSPSARSSRSTADYTLTIKYEKSDFWEKELNENFASASPIYLNRDYFGTIDNGYNYEKDFFTFSLPSDEAVTINFNVPMQADANEYWHIYLYTGDYIEILNYTINGNKTQNALPTVGLPKGNYYIKIQSSHAYYLKSSDMYTLRVDATVTDVWEKEINDDFASATSIKLNTAYYGTIDDGYNSEKDYYSFNITKSDSYNIIINTPNLYDTAKIWKVEFYNSSYSKIDEIEISGNATQHKIYKSLECGTYYILIKSTISDYAKSDATYSICVANLKANTLSVSGKKVKIKYSKLRKKNQSVALKNAITVKNAKGTVTYTLSSAKKGSKSFKKYFSVNKKTGKITVKKGLKKGTYKVKVKVNAAGTAEYKAATKTATVTITVK